MYEIRIKTMGGLLLRGAESYAHYDTALCVADKIMSDHAYDGAIAGVAILSLEGDVATVVSEWRAPRERKREAVKNHPFIEIEAAK